MNRLGLQIKNNECYTQPFVSVWNIDVLDGFHYIHSESQDLIIADPPYFKIVKEKWDNNWATKKEYIDWCIKWIEECLRVLKPNGSLYLWGAIGKHKEHPFLELLFHCENLGFHFQDFITWKKQKGIGSRKGYMYAREELLFFTKSEKHYTLNTPYTEDIAKNHGRLKTDRINYKRCSNVWGDINEVTVGNLIHTERVNHPTQKPLKACLRIVNASSNENDNVLIPFAGSGSEIIACQELKRSCIAFETESQYIDIINKRLNYAPKLF